MKKSFICKECGSSFSPEYWRKDPKYCGRPCANKAKGQAVRREPSLYTCKACGSEFTSTRMPGGNPPKYCSRKCSRTKQGRTLQRQGIWSLNHAACVLCGTTEIPHKSRGFCIKCVKYRIYRNEPVNCKQCGVAFSPIGKIDTTSLKVYCSAGCRRRHLKENPHLPKRIPKFKNKTQFENAVRELIKTEGRYIPMDEVCDRLSVCAKTFKDFNTSIIGLHRSLGIKKPRSVATQVVKRALVDLLSDMQEEKSFPEELVSPKGMVLRYDLFSKKHNILIEVDGPQHRKGHDWHSEHREICDEMKDEFAQHKNIHLLRVKFSKQHRISLEHVKQQIKYLISCKAGEAKLITVDAENSPDGVISSQGR